MLVSKRGLSFKVTLPNDETAAAILDVRASKNIESEELENKEKADKF